MMDYSQISPLPKEAEVFSLPSPLSLHAANRRFGAALYGLLIAFVVVTCFASIDTYLPTDLTVTLNLRFIEGAPIFSGYLSYFDCLVIMFSLLMIERFGVRFFASRLVLKLFFIAALLTIVLDLLNPNDEALKQLGLPLLANLPSYFFLLYMFALFFTAEEGILLAMRRIAVTAGITVGVRSVILLLLWLAGKGNTKFGGANSTLTEGDSLILFAFTASFLFASLLVKRRLWVFLAWAFTVVVQVLSFRRSALFIFLGTHVFVLMFHVVLKRRVAVMLRNAVIGLFAIGIIGFTVMQVVPDDVLQFYVYRYFGMFMGVGDSDRMAYASDSGHFDESAATLAYAFYKMDFWGYGGGSEDRINIPGATKNVWVHNVYAATWLYRGFYAFLFYVLLAFVLLLMFLKVIGRRKSLDPAFALAMGTAVFLMLMLMVTWYTNPAHIAESLKMRVLWVTVLAFIFRVTPHNFGVLFPSTVHDSDHVQKRHGPVIDTLTAAR